MYRFSSVLVLPGRGRGRYHTRLGVFGYRPDASAETEVPPEQLEARHRSCNVHQLVTAYRQYGHRIAQINPVDFGKVQTEAPELNPARYGLGSRDSVDCAGILHTEDTADSVQGLVDKLKKIYCGPISYEYLHLESEAEREWFSRRVEGHDDYLTAENKVEVARDLIRSQAWDVFLNTKFPAVKKYGGEGADTLITFLRTFLQVAAEDGVRDVVIGMPHRGRLNLQTVVLLLPPVKIFSKYAGQPEFPPAAPASLMGDIAQHFSVSTDLPVGDKTLHVSLLNNPSHLEVVNPVSMGKTRSKQLELREGDYASSGNSRRGDKVVNLQVHGDAALPGQGVNQECLMTARVPHFDVGGSLHLVLNNQVGFTTPAARARSTRYATDVAKMLAAPVIHVNAEHPEEVVRATRIAAEYQRRFRRDVFLDLNCYRKFGHNEVDDPTFTNPHLYELIRTKKQIPDLYVERLKAEGVLSESRVQAIAEEFTQHLQAQLDQVSVYKPPTTQFRRQWGSMRAAPGAVQSWDTGVARDTLQAVARQSVAVPAGFTIHPHLVKTHVKNRLKRIEEGRGIDWATAEAMAFGSLLLEGRHVRLSGQDVGRGTFSHRHVMLVDNATNEMHIPINNLHQQQNAFIEVANSILSEEAVLGFEYGMSIDNPDRLIVWEAQFGDFFNTAQTIIDTFISSGESKWLTSSGLVMLLPHGYDGAASDHSSARPERFLQLTDSRETAPDGDDVNMHVVCPTTPAQYAHLLRRQMVRNYRKPLVIISPKILLRMKEATSNIEDFLPGTHFQPVLGDPEADPDRVRRVIFTAGKHYYALAAERRRGGVADVALLRLEALCPFPLHHINAELAKYKNARSYIWSQEEARNMGAWSFVRPRLESLAGVKVRYSGRREGATVAVGVAAWHQQEAQAVVHEPLYSLK